MFQHITHAQQALKAAQSGSPGVIDALGRLVGLAGPEREALAKGRIPGWVWFAAGLGAGAVVVGNVPELMRFVPINRSVMKERYIRGQMRKGASYAEAKQRYQNAAMPWDVWE